MATEPAGDPSDVLPPMPNSSEDRPHNQAEHPWALAPAQSYMHLIETLRAESPVCHRHMRCKHDIHHPCYMYGIAAHYKSLRCNMMRCIPYYDIKFVFCFVSPNATDEGSQRR